MHKGCSLVFGAVFLASTRRLFTVLEQRRELVTGGSFDLTTIVPIGHPRRIGLFAKLDLPKYLRE